MALNFPNSPTTGALHTGVNGIQYRYDGEKWITVGSANAAGTDPTFDTLTVTGDAEFDGNVGIGTSPSQRLTVGSGSGPESIVLYTGTGNTGELRFSDTNSTYQGALVYGHNDNSMLFLTNGVNERMRIDSSGNVGIGTTSPNFKLDISASIGITEGNAVNWHDNSGTISAQIYGDSNDNLVFRNTSFATERLRINKDGDITATGSATFAGTVTSDNHIESAGAGVGYLMKSPNGTRYRLTVDDSGNLVTTAV